MVMVTYGCCHHHCCLCHRRHDLDVVFSLRLWKCEKSELEVHTERQRLGVEVSTSRLVCPT